MTFFSFLSVLYHLFLPIIFLLHILGVGNFVLGLWLHCTTQRQVGSVADYMNSQYFCIFMYIEQFITLLCIMHVKRKPL